MKNEIKMRNKENNKKKTGKVNRKKIINHIILL